MAVGDLIRSISAPGTACDAVMWDGSRLWATDNVTDKLYQIDPSDGTIIDSVNLPVGAASPRPKGMGWDGEHIWYSDDVLSSGNEKINKIKADGTLVDSISPPSLSPTGITWLGDNLWHGDANTDTLYRLNPSSGAVLESFDLDTVLASVNVTGLTYAAGRLWVSDSDGSELHKMNAAVDGVDETVDISAVVSGPRGISYDRRGIFWVAGGGSTIYAIEAPEGGPVTEQDIFQANYEQASSEQPKVTALISPDAVQRSIDTDVSNLKDGPKFYIVDVIVDIDELSNLQPGNMIQITADQPGLRAGKKMLLKSYRMRSADPAEPVTLTLWG